MSRTISTIVLSCLGILAAAGYAADRIRVENDMQHAFDRNRDGFLAEEEIARFHECMKIREQVEHLRRAAENAQGRADHMREAAEKTQAEAGHLRAEAERLEFELRRRVEAQPPRREGEGRDGDLRRPELKERIVHLRELSETAEREGRLEESRRLWAESEELERLLDRPQPERANSRDRMHAQMKELVAAAERAEREGRLDAAHDLRQKAEKLERQIDAAAERAELEAMEREVHNLRGLAERESAEGRHEKAQAVLREAESLRRHLTERVKQARQGDRKRRPDGEPSDRAMPRRDDAPRPRHEGDFENRRARRFEEGDRADAERDEDADDDEDDDDEEDDDEEEEIDRLEGEVKRLRNEVNELREIIRRIHEKLAAR